LRMRLPVIFSVRQGGKRKKINVMRYQDASNQTIRARGVGARRPELTNRPLATIPAGALEPEVHAAVGSVIKKRRKKMRKHKKKKLLKRARHKRKR